MPRLPVPCPAFPRPRVATCSRCGPPPNTSAEAKTRKESEPMRPSRRRLRALGAVSAVVVAGALAATVPSALADSQTTTITVDQTNALTRLPADFVGLSYEMRDLASWCTGDQPCPANFDARSGNLAALFRNLGQSNVRIAGNQLDRDTLWVPAGQQRPDPLPSWVQDVVTPD